jgi:hypothetical protein
MKKIKIWTIPLLGAVILLVFSFSTLIIAQDQPPPRHEMKPPVPPERGREIPAHPPKREYQGRRPEQPQDIRELERRIRDLEMRVRTLEQRIERSPAGQRGRPAPPVPPKRGEKKRPRPPVPPERSETD